MRAPAVLVLLCVGLAGCSRGGARAKAGGAVEPSTAVDCNSTVGSVACPPDPKDPSGRKLPRAGGSCAPHTCKPCGSASATAYRDFAGAPQVGWCICVATSDDSGAGTYSCFTAADWAVRSK